VVWRVTSRCLQHGVLDGRWGYVFPNDRDQRRIPSSQAALKIVDGGVYSSPASPSRSRIWSVMTKTPAYVMILPMRLGGRMASNAHFTERTIRTIRALNTGTACSMPSRWQTSEMPPSSSMVVRLTTGIASARSAPANASGFTANRELSQMRDARGGSRYKNRKDVAQHICARWSAEDEGREAVALILDLLRAKRTRGYRPRSEARPAERPRLLDGAAAGTDQSRFGRDQMSWRPSWPSTSISVALIDAGKLGSSSLTER
jgi:hypothetical protein